MSQSGIASLSVVFGLPVTVPNGGTGRSSLTDGAFLIGDGVNPVELLGPGTDGQIPIGSTGLTPVLATLTAGTGISITNGAGSITITNSAVGTSWTRVAGTTQTMAANNGYIPTNVALTTFTLPAVSAVGDVFEIAGEGSGLYAIAQNAAQQIHFGIQSTTAGIGGSLTATNRRDTIKILCTVANTEFIVLRSLSAAFLVV